MMTSKWMKVILLLGVMLVSIIISSCTPEQGTEPYETEIGLSTVTFHELVNPENIESISIAALYWSYSIQINENDEIDSFVESFLKEAQFTDDAEEVDFDAAEVFGTPYYLSITFMLQDAKHFSLCVSSEGYTCLSLDEQTYYLISPERLDYSAIVYFRKG